MSQSLCIPPSDSAPPLTRRPAPPLKVTRVPGHLLSAGHVSLWRGLQAANPDLANPCFSAGFTQAVASVRPDVEVAWIEQGREVVAIFPFQRRPAGRGVPVGGTVSDFHGLICRPGFSCDTHELLRACRLVAWDFDRLIASQSCFAPYHKLCEPSAAIDLSNGFEAYESNRRASGTRQLAQCRYLLRRVERELGPMRFVPHSSDPALLAKVLRWKSEQYRRSRWPDLFARRWGRGLAERIHATQNSGFAGMLSLLYAGNHLLAGHLGMRSETVWHYWFPAYDRRFRKFSPGLLLLFQMIQQAEGLGFGRIDLGTGITLYKQRLMNASVAVAGGSVERPSWLFLCRSLRRRLGSWLKTLAPGRPPKQARGE